MYALCLVSRAIHSQNEHNFLKFKLHSDFRVNFDTGSERHTVSKFGLFDVWPDPKLLNVLACTFLKCKQIVNREEGSHAFLNYYQPHVQLKNNLLRDILGQSSHGSIYEWLNTQTAKNKLQMPSPNFKDFASPFYNAHIKRCMTVSNLTGHFVKKKTEQTLISLK
jgi:hypothetical protein